jgi:ABC-type multidrug transport system fused ATPase/permease subunit
MSNAHLFQSPRRIRPNNKREQAALKAFAEGGVRQFFRNFREQFRPDIYRRMFPYLRAHKWAAVAVFILAVSRSFITLATPWPMAILIDYALTGKRLPHFLERLPFLHSGDAVPIIIFAVLAGLVLSLFVGALSVLRAYLKARVDARMTLAWRTDLFSHLQRLSFRYHDKKPVGDSLYRVQDDTSVLGELVWGNYEYLIVALVDFSLITVVFIRLDWKMAVLTMATLPVTMGVSARQFAKFRRRSREIKETEAEAQAIAQDALMNLRVVKAFGQEDREEQKYRTVAGQAMTRTVSLNVRQDLLQLALNLVGGITFAGILLVGALEVHYGRISVGQLVVMMAYVGALQSPIHMLGWTIGNMQMALASGERVIEVMDEKPEVAEREKPRVPSGIAGAVAFEHVNFSYLPGVPVLKDISFSASPGEVVGIVGPTGSGKTTLTNLMVRFYDPDDGRVTLDGHDLRDLSFQTLRRSVALVMQEAGLSRATVRDCIAYGRPDATHNEILAAAHAASAHEFISRLPDGYQTLVGERGTRLSGGERQRIAIARAFVMDAPVLVLDEPTSALDLKTEASLLDALDRLMEGRTTFIIAHRLSTLRRADRIMVIGNGTIVEEGPPAELLAADGAYAELYKLQSMIQEDQGREDPWLEVAEGT